MGFYILLRFVCLTSVDEYIISGLEFGRGHLVESWLYF